VKAPKWVRDEVASMLGRRPSRSDVIWTIGMVALAIIMLGGAAFGVGVLVVQMIGSMGWWFAVLVGVIGLAVRGSSRIVRGVLDERQDTP
jgi:hypothetical protein